MATLQSRIIARLRKLEGEGKLHRIFIGGHDRWQHQPLCERIVVEARQRGLAGGTVLRGPIGFGANSRIHMAKILRLSEDLPLIIEIVDREEAFDAFLPVLDEMMTRGLVTVEKVHVVRCKHSGS